RHASPSDVGRATPTRYGLREGQRPVHASLSCAGRSAPKQTCRAYEPPELGSVCGDGEVRRWRGVACLKHGNVPHRASRLEARLTRGDGDERLAEGQKAGPRAQGASLCSAPRRLGTPRAPLSVGRGTFRSGVWRKAPSWSRSGNDWSRNLID